MGRRRKSISLGLWMNGERVGRWNVSPAGQHVLEYDETWLASPLRRPVSLSMPLRPAAPYRGDVVSNYFENLLPDNKAIRQRMAERFHTTADAVSLLQQLGRDCAGALQLMPDDEVPEPAPERLTHLGEADVARHLDNVPRAAGQGTDEDGDFRLSLAGAQEKTALTWKRGHWYRSEGATPSTHIFKLPMGVVPGGIDLSTSVQNEWLCLEVLRAFDVPTARATIREFGEHTVLVVERFDRKPAVGGSWLRLPQEDFAQVAGVGPDQKYEKDGGPGVQRIMNQLLGSVQAAADRHDFMRTQILFWMLAAIDGHAKNFSLHIEAEGGYRLTPRYDVLSAYPVMGKAARQLSPFKVKMAMAVWRTNRHYAWNEIRREHFIHTAKACGIPRADELVDGLIDRVPQAVDRVKSHIPPGFPGSLAGPILAGIESAAETLRK